MKFYNQLISAAGLFPKRKEVLVLYIFFTLATGLLVQFATSVSGLSLSLTALAAGLGIELLRLKGQARQSRLEKLWPQVFDSFQNAAQSGLSLQEQLSYLGSSGPEGLRKDFVLLDKQLESGKDLGECLEVFRKRIGSRHADKLSLLIEIATELGNSHIANSWKTASTNLRIEQAMFGEVLAKQGWVLGSAKVALAAPWLVAFLLIRLEQNRLAFETELGALVLLSGLILSVLAYVAVNRLGQLTLPGRIFNAAN